MSRRQRPTYATRAEYEADTTWYWEPAQVLTVVGAAVVALCLVAFIAMLAAS